MTTSHDERHGGPYDRGRADSWYRRPRQPHYYEGGSYCTPVITPPEMTPDQVKAYNAGYSDGEASGEHKEWE